MTNTKNLSPVAAGITGLILGVAGTLAIAFSDEVTRKRATKKAKEVTDNLKKWSDDHMETLQHTGHEFRKTLSERIDPDTSTPEEIQKKLDEAEDEMERKMLKN